MANSPLNMSLPELYALSDSVQKPLVTKEIHSPNDFYRHAMLLKKYAGIPVERSLKATLEHGLYAHHAWEEDYLCHLPGLITMSSYRFRVLRELSNKALFAVGPYIHYAPLLASEDEINAMKRQLGRTLLVFHAHSIHEAFSNYSVDNHCDFIDRLRKDFDTVAICMYWRDVLLGRAEKYHSRGYNLVTAGHMYDPLFLSRLKLYILLSDVTMANELTTGSGYSVLLGRPHYLHITHVGWSSNPHAESSTGTSAAYVPYSKEYHRLFELMGEFPDHVTSEVRKLVELLWGANDVKSPQEIRDMYFMLEDMYQETSIYREPEAEQSVLALQVALYLNSGRPETALKLIDHGLLASPKAIELHRARAVALAQLGRWIEAGQILQHILLSFGDDQITRELLKQFESMGGDPAANAVGNINNKGELSGKNELARS